LYYDNGRHREAVDWYGRALELDPGNANVRTDRGTSYWNLGQADAAIDEFKKSIEIAPTHPQTLYNLGVVYLHGKNNPAEARKFWEKLLAANPNYPDSAKIRQQLDALSNTGTGAAPANRGGSGSVEDLLQRMKK
jgi:tetratricopeptide (TPR) repeat protein